MFQNFRETRPCPLDKIPDDAMMEWAKNGPEDRFGQLADTIRAWTNADGSANDEEPGTLTWTSAARRLIAAAPDPLPILNAFLERFHPSSWSGSRADILRSRLALLDQLEPDSNQDIAAWAKRVRPGFQKSIDRERDREDRESRSRDERFEW